MKLSKEILENKIMSIDYIEDSRFPTLIICVLTMVNGAVVLGHSIPLSSDNFSKEIGKNVAYDRAFAQLWQLEGYHSKSLQQVYGDVIKQVEQE